MRHEKGAGGQGTQDYKALNRSAEGEGLRVARGGGRGVNRGGRGVKRGRGASEQGSFKQQTCSLPAGWTVRSSMGRASIWGASCSSWSRMKCSRLLQSLLPLQSTSFSSDSSLKPAQHQQTLCCISFWLVSSPASRHPAD